MSNYLNEKYNLIENYNNKYDIVLTKNSTLKKNKEHKQFYKAIEKLKILKKDFNYINDFNSILTYETITKLKPYELNYIILLKEEIYFFDNFIKNFSSNLKGKLKSNLEEIIYDHITNAINYSGTNDLNDLYNKYKPFLDDKTLNEVRFNASDLIYQQFGIRIEPDDILGDNFTEEDLKLFFDKYGRQIDDAKRRMNMDLSENENFNLEKVDELFNLDISKLYKNIVVKIHPDLEMEEKVRFDKEQLLKELTQARDANDVFEMLRIKFLVDEINGIDTISFLNEKVIKRFTSKINAECKKLESEVNQIKNSNSLFSEIRITYNLDIDKKVLNSMIKSKLKNFKLSINLKKKNMLLIKENPDLIRNYIFIQQDLKNKKKLENFY